MWERVVEVRLAGSGTSWVVGWKLALSDVLLLSSLLFSAKYDFQGGAHLREVVEIHHKAAWHVFAKWWTSLLLPLKGIQVLYWSHKVHMH